MKRSKTISGTGASHPPYDHPAALPPEKLLAQCAVQFTRRCGPGGQHRNKVSTAVVLVHRPTGVKAEAGERRSQAENRSAALFRLRVNLALEIRRRKKGDRSSLPHSGPLGASHKLDLSPFFRPSPLWRAHCHGDRIELSAGHDDFPTLLAEALDVVAASDFDPRRAAETLGCTPSQLIKLLKKEPRAWVKVNQQRQRQGLHPLR